MIYRLSDINTQSMMLVQQLPPGMSDQAVRRMLKRVVRYYGLHNKYLGNGKLR